MKKNIFDIIETRIKFYNSNTHLLPPKPKFTYRHLKREIQSFHSKFVLVPADKASNNVIIIWKLHYIDILNQELKCTKAYTKTQCSEKVLVSEHVNKCKEMKAELFSFIKKFVILWC